ncbi:CopG family ribbon-helix-helix protein [Variovorax boronicumulans]|uniref:CopG family ribbon-helix-helix protein n=1 Tax=Variovorax boronicumulans TaxID=436515 RepID=UPI00358E4D34
MSTTTIRLDDELKARIAAAAARSDKSSHAFILEALSDLVERSELDEELHRIADKRWAALQRTGESVAWEDAAAYLKARAAGKKVRRPAACSAQAGTLTGPWSASSWRQETWTTSTASSIIWKNMRPPMWRTGSRRFSRPSRSFRAAR